MARRDKDRDKEKEAKSDAAAKESKPAEAKPDEPKQPDEAKRPAEAKPPDEPKSEKQELPAIEPPAPKAEPWPDATPQPMKPVEKPAETPEVRASRTPTATMAMPMAGDIGKPPDMPTTSAPPPLALGAVEDPTHMPGPKDVPAGNPDDPAPPPGQVPPGDSRSLRRGNEFALVYRVGTCVISRTGVVGTRGQWRVVEYPTSASAGNSYAKECSRFVSEGFSDYRD